MNVWFQDWFNQDYLDLYARRDDQDAAIQVDLIIKTLRLDPSQGIRILDVGCGMGRYVKIFSGLGFDITGIDLSAVLIDLGKKENPNLKLFHQTLEDLQTRKVFDLVLSLFTSFGYYEEAENNLKMLSEMSDLVRTGGQVWIDFLNPSYILNQPLKDHLTKIVKQDSRTGARIKKYFLEERRVRKVQKQLRIEKKITLETEGKKQQFLESVALYSKTQMEEMLDQCHLKTIHTFGEYNGLPLGQNTSRAIFVTQKT